MSNENLSQSEFTYLVCFGCDLNKCSKEHKLMKPRWKFSSKIHITVVFWFFLPCVFRFVPPLISPKNDHTAPPPTRLLLLLPTGSGVRPAPPKPRRSPSMEPALVFPPPRPSSSSPPTDGDAPMEAEDAAPQCRFQMESLCCSF